MLHFADAITDSLNNSGLPGVSIFIIVILLAAIGVLFKLYLDERKTSKELNEKLFNYASSFNDKLTEPMSGIVQQNKKIYEFMTDVLPNLINKRGR